METEKKSFIKRNGNLLIYISFCVIVIGMTISFLFSQIEEYNNVRDDINRTLVNIEREELRNIRLQEELEFFDTIAYMEYAARNVLGMVRPHEIVFRNTAE